MSLQRELLVVFLSRNSQRASAYFYRPTESLIDVSIDSAYTQEEDNPCSP